MKDDIMEAFSRIKEAVYSEKEIKYTYTDLIELVTKKDKKVEDVHIIAELYKSIDSMKVTIKELGNEVLNLDKIITERNEEYIVEKIIGVLNNFIFALSALSSTYSYSETKFNLKKSLSYLRSIKDQLLNKFQQHKLKVIQDEEERKIFKIFLSDIIDVIIREAITLRILKLHSILSKEMKKMYETSKSK